MAVHDHQLTGMTQIRNMQVVGEVHVTGRPGHQREAGRHEYRRHNRQAVQAVGQVDRVAGADDHEIGQQDIQQAQLRHHVLKERHNQLGGWRVFSYGVHGECDNQRNHRLPEILPAGDQPFGVLTHHLR